MPGLMLFEMVVLRQVHGNEHFPIFVSHSVDLRVVLKLVLQYFSVSITKRNHFGSPVWLLESCTLCCPGGHCCHDVSTFMQGKGVGLQSS